MRLLVKMENHIEKLFGWRRNLDYIKTKISLAIVENKEYKANFYSVLLIDIVITIVYVFFYQILGELIFGIIGWELKDYIMFWIAIMIPSKSRYIFSLLLFKGIILSGKLNNYLTKPIKPFLLAGFDITSGAAVISTFIFFIIYWFLVFYNSYNYVIYGFLVLLLGTLSYISLINFFLSFLFFSKGIDVIFNLFHNEIIFLNEKFTPKLFDKSFFSSFFYLLPSAIYGYFVIEVLKGNFELFLFYLPFFIGSIIFMILITIILWHYGLKKYEAFG